jgi:hypothetical protein
MLRLSYGTTQDSTNPRLLFCTQDRYGRSVAAACGLSQMIEKFPSRAVRRHTQDFFNGLLTIETGTNADGAFDFSNDNGTLLI